MNTPLIEKIGLSVFNLVVNLMENPKVWKYYRRILWVCVAYILIKAIVLWNN